ncbi:TPA: hypothetical protein ACPVYA_004295 [Vibrio parahaemolyticus]|uniref:hypothetical protein n=1 Tax=Vibrio parahaemolyticus TaxID=670 RepID=UPI0004A43C20|nr:hypothetical protein [Vibrio parahaemolyticus]MBE4138096.1 hypothetical protein [Vibrio parahaemolyticus]MQF42702.1 hypothetical protein [Vibrio parahaemolyticus]TOZ80021.1 hypothetical protein DXJ97_22660 [Vibrio parahaemolyticus]TOZ99741.1 hypothetical protein DXJ96_22680 [Vibrio parahaemolyticus]HCE1985929.1 hypothetical protein [Vibrio parahaemolyticus]
MKNRTKYALFLIAQSHMLFVIADGFKAEMDFRTTFALIASLLSVCWVIYEGVVNLDDPRGKAITILPKDRCVFFHRWNRVKSSGISDYLECKSCGARRIQQPDGVFQPVIDWSWLLNKSKGEKEL